MDIRVNKLALLHQRSQTFQVQLTIVKFLFSLVMCFPDQRIHENEIYVLKFTLLAIFKVEKNFRQIVRKLSSTLISLYCIQTL